MGVWAKDKKAVWERICNKYGGNKEAFDWGTWGFFDWAIGKSWPTLASISKARKFGWNRYDDTYETWIETFRSFENAGVLPSHQLITQGWASSNRVKIIGTPEEERGADKVVNVSHVESVQVEPAA